MDDFRVEFYIESEEGQSTKLQSLNEKDMEQWKKDLEAHALSEYYDKKVNIKVKI